MEGEHVCEYILHKMCFHALRVVFMGLGKAKKYYTHRKLYYCEAGATLHHNQTFQ